MTLRKHKERLHAELHALDQEDVTGIKRDIKERLTHIDAQISENQKQQARLIELVLAGIFMHEELRAKKQELLGHQQELETGRKKLAEQAAAINVTTHVERIKHIFNLLNTFESLPVDARNRTLKQFISKIHYTRLMPEDIRKLSTRNRLRREFPYDFAIEYV